MLAKKWYFLLHLIANERGWNRWQAGNGLERSFPSFAKIEALLLTLHYRKNGGLARFFAQTEKGGRKKGIVHKALYRGGSARRAIYLIRVEAAKRGLFTPSMDMGAHHEKNGGKMRSLSCCSSENCISWTVTICICSSKNEKKWPKNVFPLHFLATTILMLLYFRWNPVPMRTIPTAFVHPFASQEREFSPCTKCFSFLLASCSAICSQVGCSKKSTVMTQWCFSRFRMNILVTWLSWFNAYFSQKSGFQRNLKVWP